MSTPGKLIVLEGLDGSGKSTQTELLAKSLISRGKNIRRLKFPDYESKSSALVKMYLSGEIGELNSVNLYAASGFYACDRYISYATDWKRDYLSGKLLLCDRYATSNLIYQTPKLPKTQWDSYMRWLWDFEFDKMGLPEPELVIYLDMLPETSRSLLEKRRRETGETPDIHEQNLRYLRDCREAALYTAGKLGWRILRCCDGKKPLPVGAVAAMIEETVCSEIY